MSNAEKKYVVVRGAIIIASFSIISKLLGLVRERLLSSTFGASEVTDAYFAAFRVPDFLFHVFVLGAMSAAFIPVFLEYYHKKNGHDVKAGGAQLAHESSETSISSVNFGFVASAIAFFRNPTARKKSVDDHWVIANTVMNTMLLVFFVFGILSSIFAPLIVSRLMPGFGAEVQNMTVRLTRIMLISTVFFGVSNVFGSLLQAFKRFFFFAIAPVFYNVGIIVGIFFFVPLWGPMGLGYGVVLGAVFHMAVQLPGALKLGYQYQAMFRWSHAGVRQIFRLLIPRALGMIGTQLNQMVNTFVASGLASGSVAVFYFADNLQSIPVSIFGVSFAVAAFPVLAERAGDVKTERFVHEFSKVFRNILYVVIPLSLFMILLRAQIVRVALGSGKFDWEDTVMTLQTFAAFSVSLFAQSTIPLLARAFYARQDTRTPVFVSFVSVGVNIVCAFFLSKIYGVVGIALAFSLATIFHMTILWMMLHHRLGGLDDERITKSVFLMSVASFLSGWLVYATLHVVEPLVGTDTFMGIFTQGLLAGLVGIGGYVCVTWLFRLEEARLFMRRFNGTRLGNFF